MREIIKKIPRIVCAREAHYIPNPEFDTVDGQKVPRPDVLIPAAYEQRETEEKRYVVDDAKTGEPHEFLTPEAARDFERWNH